MNLKYFKFISIYPIVLMFLAGTMPIAFASMDMDTLREKFTNETGKQWFQVTSEERRDFMYKIRGHKKKEEREKRVEGVTVPYYIRESFRREKKMKWEDATEKEQKLFIKKSEQLKKDQGKFEKKKLKDEEQRLRVIKRENAGKKRA